MHRCQPNEPSQLSSSVSRREFIAGASIAAATIVQAKAVHAYQVNSQVRLGVIGCGGRGTWIAKLFPEHGGYEIVALHDYFQDRVDKCGATLSIDSPRRYTGLKGYLRLLEERIDAVVIESPPYFHPEQAAASVAAGKHVYLAKPVAVDVPGCKSIQESGRQASENGLSFLVDFQTRAEPLFIEAMRRVHAGALGKFAFGESTYHAGNPFTGMVDAAKEASTNPEARLRAWGLDRALSGDIITEQNIHTLDVASWIMNTPPVAAFGIGSRKVRGHGDCWDTFSVTFEYPDNVGIAFSSRQFDGFGSEPKGFATACSAPTASWRRSTAAKC